MQAENLTWQNESEMISQSFPSGIVELSDQIISRIKSFKWLKDSATLYFAPVCMEAGVPMENTLFYALLMDSS